MISKARRSYHTVNHEIYAALNSCGCFLEKYCDLNLQVRVL